MRCKRSSKNGQVLVGFQTTEAFGCFHYPGGVQRNAIAAFRTEPRRPSERKRRACDRNRMACRALVGLLRRMACPSPQPLTHLAIDPGFPPSRGLPFLHHSGPEQMRKASRSLQRAWTLRKPASIQHATGIRVAGVIPAHVTPMSKIPTDARASAIRDPRSAGSLRRCSVGQSLAGGGPGKGGGQ
jgi:hypothetical protein